jgi:hypothetical protein
MRHDPKRLLGGHATDTLTEGERRELLAAALRDQETFDRLLEAEGLRELLASPGAREALLEALDRPTRWERVRGWLARPATLGDLAAVAAALVLALGAAALFRAATPVRTPAAATRLAGTPLGPAAVAALAVLPARTALPASLEREPPGAPARLRASEPMGLRISASAPARVALITVGPDGSAAQAWPPAGTPPARLIPTAPGAPASRVVALPAPLLSGRHRVRLVAAPIDVDLGAASASDLGGLAARLTLFDLDWEVSVP